MAKNECGVCGGGFGAYTAPEAKCICKTPSLTASQREKVEHQKDMKRQMLRAEMKYLLASGWQVHENFESADKGFIWKDLNGDPISQTDAVATQKEWDEDPSKQVVIALRVNIGKMVTAIKVNRDQGLPTERLDGQHQALVVELKEQMAERQTG